jgi:hypothetical protein
VTPGVGGVDDEMTVVKESNGQHVSGQMTKRQARASERLEWQLPRGGYESRDSRS